MFYARGGKIVTTYSLTRLKFPVMMQNEQDTEAKIKITLFLASLVEEIDQKCQTALDMVD